jgi:hypothetical protein
MPRSTERAPISTNTPFVVSADRAPARSSTRLGFVVPGLGLGLVLFALARGTDGLAVPHALATSALTPPLETAKLDPPQLEEIVACASDMALVQRDDLRVCVDRYEASLVELRANGEEKPWSPYVSPPSTGTFKAVSRAGVVPQGYVSRNQAEAACFAAGKRLCTASEWRVACEGPEGTTFPYGDREDPKACNTHGVNPLLRLFGGASTKGFWRRIEMNHPALNQVPGTVAATGAFGKCTNGFGVHDMVGNLHEWTSEKKGAFRGGYYRDTHENGPGCRYVTKAHAASYHDYSTGFRCCRDPE